MVHLARLIGLLVAWLLAVSAWAQVSVSGNGGFDYQADVISPWEQPDHRIVVFERLNPATLSGDLYVTRSEDSGETWSDPTVAVATPANERHSALVQTGETAFQLFYLSNASGGFRIHRASSADATTFVEKGSVDLGWPTADEINPHVIRRPDGTLIMTYHRLGGAAYIAKSADDGVTWDTDRVQVSPANAALPRLAFRESDNRYLLVYQTGASQLQMWSRTTTDPADWSSTPIEIISGGNNHDGLPLVLSDGRFVLLWARVAEGNFQIFSSESDHGLSWSPATQQISRPNLANVQPHGLDLGDGMIDLYWGAGQDGGGSDYNILRTLVSLDRRFKDRFEL